MAGMMVLGVAVELVEKVVVMVDETDGLTVATSVDEMVGDGCVDGCDEGIAEGCREGWPEG